MTQQVPWMDLVPGRQYRIEDIIEGGELPLLGIFDRSYSYPIITRNRIHTGVSTLFNNIRHLDGTNKYNVETTAIFDTNTHIFYETAESIVANQVARGLSTRLPERNAYLIRQFLQGSDPLGRGVNRFPARSRKNRKNRKSRKH